MGDALHQLEQEVKLDPNPGWSLPELTGILPGVEVHALADVALETTYYDTADLRLARHHLTLRFRRQTELAPGSRRLEDRSTTEVWTVKLPSSSDSTVLARTEVTWPPEGTGATATGRRSGRRPRATGRGLQRSDYEFEKVHPEAAHFVQAAALGRPLEPVAHLSSIRRRTELRTSDGRPLAEVDEDTITGRDLLASQERLFRHGDTPDVRFREVEVELADGSALEVLEAVVNRLEEAGARRSPGKSKLARVLGGGSAEVDLADLGRRHPKRGARKWPCPASCGNRPGRAWTPWWTTTRPYVSTTRILSTSTVAGWRHGAYGRSCGSSRLYWPMARTILPSRLCVPLKWRVAPRRGSPPSRES